MTTNARRARALYSVPEEVFYIVRAYFTRKKFGVNKHICMNIEDVPWNIIVQMPGH